MLEMVINNLDGRGTAQLTKPGNRGWATAIVAANALGWAIPLITIQPAVPRAYLGC